MLSNLLPLYWSECEVLERLEAVEAQEPVRIVAALSVADRSQEA